MDDLTMPRGDTEMWRQAFLWLSAAEFGQRLAWPPSGNVNALRTRVETLVLLFDILPRLELRSLPGVIEFWFERFGREEAVSIAALRTTARDFLHLAHNASAETDLGRWQRALSIARGRHVTEVDLVPAVATDAVPIVDEEAEQDCATGLVAWFRELENDPRWRCLPEVVPGERPVAIEDVYVELYAIPEFESGESFGNHQNASRSSRRRVTQDIPVVSVAAMVSRTIERCVVIGEPGSGKSTVVHWLAWATLHGTLADFDLAIVVKLSGFATAALTSPNLTIVEYFFQSTGLSGEAALRAAHCLRRSARGSHRHLLLLDGWDEIPPPQRDVVRQRILQEEAAFLTLITSRPAGFPLQLRDHQHVECYQLAGFSPRAAEELVQKLLSSLGRAEEFAAIHERISTDPDLHDMATNPFLLSMLVRAMDSNIHEESAIKTRADVYRQIVAWIRNQFESTRKTGSALTIQHLGGLAEASYQLLLETELPQYIFPLQTLERSLYPHSVEPLLRSRFVNRPVPALDEYNLLHATVQEYLAAEHAVTLSETEMKVFLEQTFVSASRFVVLEFFAGLSGTARRMCQEYATTEFGMRDRFLQVAMKVARLSAAGRWAADATDGTGTHVRDLLWEEIRLESDMALCQSAVETLAELDPVFLARRARQESPLSTWAVNCIVSSIPATIARQERLDELLDEAWQDYMGFEAAGGATEFELDVIRKGLSRVDAPPDELRTHIIQAGAIRDRAAVTALLAILTTEDLAMDLREQAIFSLGRIGGRQAVDALVDVVISEHSLPAGAVRIAAAALRHTPGSSQALDPQGRDRLLRRLAALPGDDSNLLTAILSSMEGFPIRDGAPLVAAMTQDSQADPEVRLAAAAILASVTDRCLVQQIVSTVDTEGSEKLAALLLTIAVKRSLSIPLKWLERRILSCRDRARLHRLLKSYLQLIPHGQRKEQIAAAEFLDEFVKRAMHNDAAGENCAKGLVAGLGLVGPVDRPLLTEKSRRAARNFIAKFGNNPDINADAQMLLAVSIVLHFRDNAASHDIRRALDAILDCNNKTDDGPAIDRLATALAESLADLSVQELLSYPADYTVVQSVLRSRAVKQGWLIFANHIMDAEGRVLASAQSPIASIPTGAVKDLQGLFDQLKGKNRSVLMSYWFMVRRSGPCHPDDSRKRIYEVLAASVEGTTENDDARLMQEMFRDGFPKCEAWMKALQRIEKRFARRPEAVELLRPLGLCKSD